MKALGLGKPASGALQKKLTSQIFSVGRVKKIRKTFDPRFTRRKDKLLMWINQERERLQGTFLGKKMTPAQQEMVYKYTKWKNLVEQEFNAYRKEITGAAAAFVELERLKESVINIDQSETAHAASLDLYEAELERGIEINKRLLERGFKSSADEGYAEAFDQEWTATSVPPRPSSGKNEIQLPNGVTIKVLD